MHWYRYMNSATTDAIARIPLFACSAIRLLSPTVPRLWISGTTQCGHHIFLRKYKGNTGLENVNYHSNFMFMLLSTPLFSCQRSYNFKDPGATRSMARAPTRLRMISRLCSIKIRLLAEASAKLGSNWAAPWRHYSLRAICLLNTSCGTWQSNMLHEKGR